MNLNEYYSKISSIRNRILSKHGPSQQANENAREISFDGKSRNPSLGRAVVRDQLGTVDCRVKHLDDINSKIRNILVDKKAQKPLTILNTDILSNKTVAQRVNGVNLFSFPKQETLELQNNKERFPSFGIDNSNHKAQIMQKQQIKGVFQLPNATRQWNNIKGKERLIKLLLRQVEHDSSLRELKQQYYYSRDPNKQKILVQKFTKQTNNFSQSQLLQWVHLHQQQRNPFFSTAQPVCFQKLVALIIQAKRHWQTQVKEGVSIQCLQRQLFTIGEFDVGNKGYLNIQDLVCLININSNATFRKRDLFGIFARFKKESKDIDKENRLTYEAFLNYVSK